MAKNKNIKGKEQEPSLEIGDLVKSFEYYANGDIVRDGGVGIVLESPVPQVGSIRSVNYRVKVYCTKKYSARWFHTSEIELINKGTYKPNKYINTKKEKKI